MTKKEKYTFETKIRGFRADARMTQQDLADAVGVSRQTIMQLENNKHNPSLLLAHAIAEVFDISIYDIFLFGEEEK